MRITSSILIIAIIIFAGCKPKSTTEIKTNDSTNTSNKGLKMPDIGDLKKNSNNSNPNNSNNSGWSKNYRDKFVQGCITKASEQVSESQASSYCNCMVVKVEAKYPNENDVDAKLTAADIESMRSGCTTNSTQSNPNNPNQPNNYNNPNQPNQPNNYNSQSWSLSDQREFMDNCTPGASKTLGTNAANNYCDCMLKKLMQEYPNSKDVGNVSKTHMSSLASDCLGR